MSTVQSNGEAWDRLEAKVDPLVQAFMQEKGLPGMTVAVTKQGRLLLTKGYGFALVDGRRTLPMKPWTRSKIGSVTKAAVTGPSGYQLMKAKKIDPATRRLYGKAGIFRGAFDADIDIGIKAHAPDSAQWKGWYEKITIQNLLDHAAGFARSGGDREDVAKMFGVAEADVTPEQEHRYFLRTRELRYEPGNPPPGLDPPAYSNHGFGVWALLIKQMSGKPYADYVREEYLRPTGLHNAVRPQRAHPDSCDAYGHRRDTQGALVALPFEESSLGIGLAAGGFTAAAQSVLRLTASLDRRYTTAELDSMGWSKSSKGRLSHSGSILGGASYAVMYPDGYRTSTENLDLSDVHVAVTTNIQSSDDLQSLAGDIAVAVPASDVPATFDLWKQGKARCSCEYTRDAVPAGEYQGVFDEAARAGYRLEWIDGYSAGGKAHFNVIFRTDESGADWVSHHNLTGAAYQKLFDQHRKEGFALDHVDSYAVGEHVLYAAIWTKSAAAVAAYHGRGAEEHQKSFDSLTSAGWRPKVISVASVDGRRQYAALYTKEAIGGFEARSFLTPGEYQAEFDQNKARGRRLRYLNSYLHDGTLRFSAIWAEQSAVSASRASHGLTAARLRTACEDAASAGLRTRFTTGCEQGGKVQFAACWTN
jgi:CubicO group peptidase (beta-lactamase class C family)